MSGSEFDGSNFSNNLVSDLAPLLTLFGEQVTKQFLSQAMGYGDDILLAMAPLGILTCIVSAIRVGGRKSLKALVGRAREGRATAEIELLSSTSDTVCEKWSGMEIVRERGKPKTKEFIYRPVTQKISPHSDIVFDLKTACDELIMSMKAAPPRVLRLWGIDNMKAMALYQRLMQQPPNLTLNVRKANTSPLETWLFACLGAFFQLGVFAIASLVTYHWRLGRDGSSSTVGYGLPLFLIGSVLLCAGIFCCSYIVESMTEEIDFEFAKDDFVKHQEHIKVVRIQAACTVGDQRFGSYAIKNEERNMTLRTSRINEDHDFSFLSIFATGLSLVGYIIQFVGLRAMHWSVSITVLGATLIMACIRAYVRRGLAADPQVEELREGQELSWVAMDALGLDRFELGGPATVEDSHDYTGCQGAEILDRNTVDATVTSGGIMESSTLARKAVEVRDHLTQLVDWHDETRAPAAQLAEAITETLRYIFSGQEQFEMESVAGHLLFSEMKAQPPPSDLPTWFNRERQRHPVLSFRLLTAEEAGSKADDCPRKSRSLFPMETQTFSEGSLHEDDTQGMKDGDQGSLVEDEAIRAPERGSHSTAHKINKPQGPSTERGRLEMGDLFWENRDYGNEQEIPPGMMTYAFRDSDDVLGEFFKWECGVTLAGPSFEGPERTRYSFVARSIMQTSDRQVVDMDGPERHGWVTDVKPLAAIISLWTSTIEKMTVERDWGRVRVLGCGLDVSVPDEIPVESDLMGMADFFKLWVEREATARPVFTHLTSHNSNYTRPDLPQITLSRPLFGTSVLSRSRRLRREALEAKHKEENGRGPSSTARNSLARSLAQRNDIMLPYISPPQGKKLDEFEGQLFKNLAVTSFLPVPYLCAQEIFYAFLLQVVSSITKVKGGASRRTRLPEDDGNTLRGQHPGLSQLASIVLVSGLAANEEEAYMLIIPPFHAHGLLPRHLGSSGEAVEDS